MTDAPSPATRLLQAETDTTVARQRLSTTLGQLQTRLDPKTLARGAMDDVKTAGSDARQATLNAAVRNPGALAGAAAAVALFLLRRPLLNLYHRATDSAD